MRHLPDERVIANGWIYRRDSKYQEAFEPPCLDMMSAFQIALRAPDTTLLVAGFSFSDSHLAPAYTGSSRKQHELPLQE